MALGLALTLVSLLPEVIFIESLDLEGEAGASSSSAVAFPQVRHSLASVAFQEVPPCSLRLFVLDGPGAARYNATSTPPPPEQSLNCERTGAAFGQTIVLLVFENIANVTQRYSVRADLFVVSQPYAAWVLPAFPLLLTGLTVLIVRRLRGGLTRIADEYASRDETKKGKK